MAVPSCMYAEKRFWLPGTKLNAATWFFRRQSYRTDDSVSFHPSVYLRSRARRSERLRVVF